MKTIFRSTSFALLFAAILALGAVAGFGQDPAADPCKDAGPMEDKFRTIFADKSQPGMKQRIEIAKQYLEKFGSCEAQSTKDFSTYLKDNLPKWEKSYGAEAVRLRRAELEKRFATAMGAKNWDELYASGKALLAEDADVYRELVLALGSVGLDETAKTPPVTKWNDETLRYARQAIQDMEANKTFKQHGVKIGNTNFLYLNKDDALGWMNYTIGYILMFDKNDRKTAAIHMYKASQAPSDTRTNPEVYRAIGNVYYDDARKLKEEAVELAKNPPVAADTPEVRQQKTDALKAKVGMLNGTLERAMDAFSRAHKFAPKTPAGKTYQDGILKTLTELYTIRFDKTVGLTAWMDTTVTKPFPNPSTAISPVNDADADSAATSPATPPATAPIKPTTPPAKPGAAKPQATVTTDAKGTASSAVVKPAVKPVAKRKGTK